MLSFIVPLTGVTSSRSAAPLALEASSTFSSKSNVIPAENASRVSLAKTSFFAGSKATFAADGARLFVPAAVPTARPMPISMVKEDTILESVDDTLYSAKMENELTSTAVQRLSKIERDTAGWNIDEVGAARILKQIVACELAGVVRYTHYACVVRGPYRLPLVDFFKAQASESLVHAQAAGDILAGIGEHPDMFVTPIEESHNHSIYDLLAESYEHESNAVSLYRDLFQMTEGKSVYLEEFARDMVRQEELHRLELRRMLRDFKGVTI